MVHGLGFGTGATAGFGRGLGAGVVTTGRGGVYVEPVETGGLGLGVVVTGGYMVPGARMIFPAGVKSAVRSNRWLPQQIVSIWMFWGGFALKLPLESIETGMVYLIDAHLSSLGLLPEHWFSTVALTNMTPAELLELKGVQSRVREVGVPLTALQFRVSAGSWPEPA